MKILLKRITLLNFKGIRSMDLKLGQITNISGENGTGKTTVMDAFLWLLFGKDSTDRKDFELKTLDADNKPFQRMDHEVMAFLDVDGDDVVLKRTFKEKWEKKRGTSQPEFTGHTTSYYWNDVPLKLEEYTEKVNSILKESIFKLLTNTGYFNSQKWQDRRNVLLEIAGKIENGPILDKISNLNNKAAIADLTNVLNSKKSIEEYKKELGAKKKKIKDELDLVPSRIDEANRSLPEEKNYADIEASINEALIDLESTESLLMNKTQAQKEHQNTIRLKLNEMQAHKNRQQQIEFETKNSMKDRKMAREQEIMDTKRDARAKEDDLLRITGEWNRQNKIKQDYLADQEKLRQEWARINNEQLVFDENEFSCPTCKRAYEEMDTEAKKKELTKNFNSDKSAKLTKITTAGQELKPKIAAIDIVLSDLEAQGKAARAVSTEFKEKIAELESTHTTLSQNESLEVIRIIAANEENIALNKKIAALQEEIDAPDASQDNTNLLQHKRALNERIQALRNDLSSKDHRQKILARIDQLQDQEKEMANELAQLEGTEFSIEQFIKAKMDELESRINGRFRFVKFKLFEEQINGGQVECCEALINGVPYSDANTASKINAGLDVINTLSKHYNAYAPVFVDNAESINTLIPVSSQLIRLVVSKDKKLIIETQKDLFSEAVA